jgi:DNA-binding transcriptional LysR family regulator
MHVRALKTFVELARSDSIRQAAQHLNITPTAVSRQIDQLEYFFRTELIDRTSAGIQLTEAGRLLVERAQLIANEIQITQALIDDLRGLQRGCATIRAGGAVVAGLLAPVVHDLHDRYPGLRFHIDVANAGDVFSGVNDGLADPGVTIFSPEGNRLMICHSRPVSHAVVVGASHPFAALTSISMQELAQVPLAIPDATFGVRQNLERIARASGVVLDPAFETGSLDLQKELAILGSAALILPPLCCSREIVSGLLTAIPLADDSRIETSLDICRAPNRALPFAAQQLLKLLASYIEAHIKAPV